MQNYRFQRGQGQPGFLLVLLLTLLFGASLMAATWYISSQSLPPSQQELQDDNQFLVTEVHTLRERLAQLQSQQALLEQETRVLRQANRLLRTDESQRQQQLNQMQSELDFFRGLAGSGAGREGLDAYRIELLPTASPRVFQFTLTLTQNLRRAAIVDGSAKISLEGVLNHQPVTLSWAELNDGTVAEPQFRFKYFQQLKGYLNLPEQFAPTRLVVELDPGRRGKEVLRSWDWEQIAGLNSGAESAIFSSHGHSPDQQQ